MKLFAVEAINPTPQGQEAAMMLDQNTDRLCC
jgi:hypothetical protein